MYFSIDNTQYTYPISEQFELRLDDGFLDFIDLIEEINRFRPNTFDLGKTNPKYIEKVMDCLDNLKGITT